MVDRCHHDLYRRRSLHQYLHADCQLVYMTVRVRFVRTKGSALPSSCLLDGFNAYVWVAGSSRTGVLARAYAFTRAFCSRNWIGTAVLLLAGLTELATFSQQDRHCRPLDCSSVSVRTYRLLGAVVQASARVQMHAHTHARVHDHACRSVRTRAQGRVHAVWRDMQSGVRNGMQLYSSLVVYMAQTQEVIV